MTEVALRKKLFLESLKSQSGYRRYFGAPIRYPGGKSAAVGYIIQLLPDDISRVVSPFIGGGSVEVAIAKELGIEVVAFDIFDILVVFWQVILDRHLKEKMLSTLHRLTPNKQTYMEVKETLKKHWRYVRHREGSPQDEINDKPLLAALFFFNYQLSYGPGFLGWPSSVYLNERTYNSLLEKLAAFYVPNLRVYHADFRDVLPKHREDFLYLDPPYYIGGDSNVFKGIYPSRNYPIHHNGFPHEDLRNMLREHKGGFLLSYNNCSTIRAYYPDDKYFFPKWHYSMGLGETRIGKNRAMRKGVPHKKESNEIIIYRPRYNP